MLFMKRIFPGMLYAGTVFCMYMPLQAQVHGNPSLKIIPRQSVAEKTDSRLSPDLQKLYDQLITARKTPANERLPQVDTIIAPYIQLRGTNVVVDITIKENATGAQLALRRSGLQITGSYGRVVSGVIAVSLLPALQNLPAVQYIKPAYHPLHQGISRDNCNTWRVSPPAFLPTPVKSQGDTAQGSWLARKNCGVNGKGVKVGIISDSYNSFGGAGDGMTFGELPGIYNPFNLKSNTEVLQDLDDNSGSDEGRAMAEIVHDIAPGAQLAFHTGALGAANFAQGIQRLTAAGCKVITDDIFYFDEPFFQDGIIAQSVDLAKQKGVSYFSAAGNQAANSYESDYRGSPDEVLGSGRGTAHNFNGPADMPRYFQPIFIPSGGSFIASFQWDQPCFSAGSSGATTDMDIYLLDNTGNIVAAGIINNIMSGDPIEVFGFDNRTAENTFFLVITKRAGPDPSRIKYILFKNGAFFITNPGIPGIFAPTLVGHAKAAGAIATGAVFYGSTPAYGLDTADVERFSSVGGVANYFNEAGSRIVPMVRQKPEIIAPDGVNTSFFNPAGAGDIQQDNDIFPNFFGTSAAAPHAAGIAALMLEATRTNRLTPGQLKGILTATAHDMDNLYTTGFDKGFDYNTGYGLVDAAAAVAAVKYPALYTQNLDLQAACSTTPAATRNWKIVNPNPFEMEAHWFVSGTNQYGSITAPPGDFYFNSAVSTANQQAGNMVILYWEDNFGFIRLDIASSSNLACNSSSQRSMENTGTAETAKPIMAEVFPNPSAGIFRVFLSLPAQESISLQLFSIDGKKLMEKRINQTQGIVPMDASAYKPGMYFLNIKQGVFNKTIKLIKQ
jgi:subtilisin family serine protease